MSKSMTCIVCHKNDWLRFFKSLFNQSVCSDCRPLNFSIEINQCKSCGHLQKVLNDSYHQRVDELYRTYQAYQLNNGSEHLTFTGEVPFTRSNQILQNCKLYIDSVNKVLDIGCGSGSMLKALSTFNPKLELSGYDISDHFRAKILKIPQVEHFYSGELHKIEEKFDLIVLSHVLEHIENVSEFLQNIKKLLTENGRLLIQVPSFLENPLDFFVYDHISHFTETHLFSLLAQYFTYVQAAPNLIGRELTFIVSMQQLPELKSKYRADEQEKVNNNLAFIKSLEKTLAAISQPVYVFSTGPGGTLLGNILGENLAGFIDEDEARVGKYHLGRTIFSPKSIPDHNLKVVLPFLTDFNEKIQQRLDYINFLN